MRLEASAEVSPALSDEIARSASTSPSKAASALSALRAMGDSDVPAAAVRVTICL
jgi:hypothetical protein